MESIARELLRAIRAHRSQVQFARRLGYKSNPVAEWEGGRRFPVASELLRACQVVGIDVPQAMERFHPRAAAALGSGTDAGVAAWLDALKGDLAIGTLAQRSGHSRYAVARWLAGRTRPRVPDFLALIEATTGRLVDWVAALVDIELVPSLRELHERTLRARRLLHDEPWSVAVLGLLETQGVAALQAHDPVDLAGRLHLTPETVSRCLAGLVEADVLRREGDRYVPTGGRLTIDTDAVPGAVDALKRHWSAVAMENLGRRAPADAYGYTVFGVSREDLWRLRELHQAYYRQVRAIVASSQPTDTVALLNLQLVELSTGDATP